MIKHLYVLYDCEDEMEPVAIVDSPALHEAVEQYLKAMGFWETQFFNDGSISMTGKEWLAEGLHEAGFKVLEIPDLRKPSKTI